MNKKKNSKYINTMMSCIKSCMERMKQLARAAWEKSKHAGGAFLNRIFVDLRTGHIYYDCELKRVLLKGWKIIKGFNTRLFKWEWRLSDVYAEGGQF